MQGTASAFAPLSPAWAKPRFSGATTLHLFGGADEKPLEAAKPQVDPAQQAEMEKEMQMAYEFREKMSKKLQETECKGLSKE